MKIAALNISNPFSGITVPAESALINPTKTSIGKILTELLPFIFGAAAMALLIYLIIGGFQMMTSRGDPKGMQSAQAKITNAIIGFVIIVFAYFIIQIVGQVLGLQGNLFSQIFGGK